MQNAIATLAAIDGGLNVSWADGKGFTFHPVWLRERSPDTDTIDPATGQRKIDAGLLPLELRINAAERTGNAAIRLKFSDGTVGIFNADDLRAAIEPVTEYDLLGAKELWDAKRHDIPRHALAGLETSTAGLLALLNDLARNGFVVVTGVPTEKNGLLQFAGLIGNIKLTNWGGVEDVKSAVNAFDLTLTGRALEPHVDNPYRFSTIGYVLLHCLHNSCGGGESLVVDGFAVAERLRREHPDAFATLTKTPVRFLYEDDTAILENYRPLISVDAEGRLRSVAYSNRTEFSRPGSMAEMSAYYAARHLFASLIYAEEMTLEFKLAPGEMAIFDNYRVLHGRRAFDTAQGERHMRQAYMDRDIVSSRQRVLMRELAGKGAAARTGGL